MGRPGWFPHTRADVGGLLIHEHRFVDLDRVSIVGPAGNARDTCLHSRGLCADPLVVLRPIQCEGSPQSLYRDFRSLRCVEASKLDASVEGKVERARLCSECVSRLYAIVTCVPPYLDAAPTGTTSSAAQLCVIARTGKALASAFPNVLRVFFWAGCTARSPFPSQFTPPI
jgi:hypothetical protein